MERPSRPTGILADLERAAPGVAGPGTWPLCPHARGARGVSHPNDAMPSYATRGLTGSEADGSESNVRRCHGRMLRLGRRCPAPGGAGSSRGAARCALSTPLATEPPTSALVQRKMPGCGSKAPCAPVIADYHVATLERPRGVRLLVGGTCPGGSPRVGPWADQGGRSGRTLLTCRPRAFGSAAAPVSARQSRRRETGA